VSYAKVVLGPPVEGPFDYEIPPEFKNSVKPGVRVRINFRNKKDLGYVVATAPKTQIKYTKPILSVLDESPILDKNILSLTKELSEYYCCSWGEAIETAIPEVLRRGNTLPETAFPKPKKQEKMTQEKILLHDGCLETRWGFYLASIRDVLQKNRKALILLPDINSFSAAKDIIREKLNILPEILYRKQPDELGQWLKIKQNKASIVLGTRSAIFAQLDELGLIIIDEEHNSVYKQDQVPHYHAREIALIRAKKETVKIILGSSCPSLEAYYLASRNKMKYIRAEQRNPAEIRIIEMKNLPLLDRKHKIILSRYLQDSILSTISSKGKVLLFLNRKGFATVASCSTCGRVIKCPRCNVNLIYYFGKGELSCGYCNFKMVPPKICPGCNSGYIKYSGAGTEKIESELSRVFPQARIRRMDKWEESVIQDSDIIVSAQSVIGHSSFKFSLVAVLGVDNSLNRVDFRASEKTFAAISGLSGLTGKEMIIQTNLADNYLFSSIEKKDPAIFYDEELRMRRQLGFPPYQHLAFVKLRSPRQEKVKMACQALFLHLKEAKNKDVEIVSEGPGQPAQLRGNYYRQILVKSKNAKHISGFLKLNLKKFRHSGIIVTVDVDPV
jgi:primosomal protein N' (replication factor Y)